MNEKRNEAKKEERKIEKIEGPKDIKKEESKKERWLIKLKENILVGWRKWVGSCFFFVCFFFTQSFHFLFN